MNGPTKQEDYSETTDGHWIDTDITTEGILNDDEVAEDENGWAIHLTGEELGRLQWQAENPDLADPLIGTLPRKRASL